MLTPWRFDKNHPYEDSFEQALMTQADSQPFLEMVKRICVEIQRDPRAHHRGTVLGKFVYIVKSAAVTCPGGHVDPLLVVYTLSEKDHLIQRVFICRAAEYVDDLQRATMDTIERALRPAIERAIRNAGESH